MRDSVGTRLVLNGRYLRGGLVGNGNCFTSGKKNSKKKVRRTILADAASEKGIMAWIEGPIFREEKRFPGGR